MKIFNIEYTTDPNDNQEYYQFMTKINLQDILIDFKNLSEDQFFQKIGKEFIQAIKDAKNIDA